MRLNTFYEQSDTFRDYGHFERYGINPTVTFMPDDDTKIKLSYEYYHDERLADRGNPSQSGPVCAAARQASTRFNPATPFVSNWSTRSSGARSTTAPMPTCRPAMAFIEHDFGNGLSVKNGTIYASYLRGYRNVYPGNGPLAGAVNPADTALTSRPTRTRPTATTRSTRPTSPTRPTGPVLHTLTFGTEFGLQAGFAQRDTGFFPENGLANTIVVNPFAPTYFGPVTSSHHISTTRRRRSRYRPRCRSPAMCRTRSR